jgi:phenylalanyl-tRNA synthetase beta chain
VGRAERLDITPPAWAGPVLGFELDLSDAPRPAPRYSALPVTPSSWRDLNLILTAGTSAGDVVRAMRRAGGALLESVDVVSEFRSDEVGSDRRAVQFRLTVRAPDRTVRDEEVDGLVSRLLKTLEQELDARLRTS